MVCGPDLQFYELISRWPGATQENKIFNISEIHQKFQFNQMDGMLLADNNYPSSGFVMTPVEQPENVQECMYNDCHKRTYNIEKAIKLWKQRFKCLQTVLNNKEGNSQESTKIKKISLAKISYFVDTTQMIIQATGVLHNIAIQRHQPIPNDNFSRIPKTSNHQYKDSRKRKYFADTGLGLIDRDNFIAKYFTLE